MSSFQDVAGAPAGRGDAFNGLLAIMTSAIVAALVVFVLGATAVDGRLETGLASMPVLSGP